MAGLATVTLDTVVKSYCVPDREIQPAEFRFKRDSAALLAAQRLESLGLGYGPNSITVRSVLPFFDLELDGRALGAGGADSRDQWVVGALTEGTNLAWINIAMDNNKVMVIFGHWYDSAAPAIVAVRYEKGGGVAYEFQIQMGYVQEEHRVYYPEMIVYNPFETVIVRLVPRVTVAAGERFGLYAMLAEPKGQRAGGVPAD